MKSFIAIELARMHAEYSIYPSAFMENDLERNIVEDIRLLGEEKLQYLPGFYDEYLKQYMQTLMHSDMNTKSSNNQLDPRAKSIDLPFIGPDVLEENRARYMFVFEGSLQKKKILSIAVLSCFWLLESDANVSDLINRYYRRGPYEYIRNSLIHSPAVANNIYVVDSLRVAKKEGGIDQRANKDLLRGEIELLNPDLVIAVGNTAKSIVGPSKINGLDKRYVHIPFPNRRKSQEANNEALRLYDLLKERVGQNEARYV